MKIGWNFCFPCHMKLRIPLACAMPRCGFRSDAERICPPKLLRSARHAAHTPSSLPWRLSHFFQSSYSGICLSTRLQKRGEWLNSIRWHSS